MPPPGPAVTHAPMHGGSSGGIHLPYLSLEARSSTSDHIVLDPRRQVTHDAIASADTWQARLDRLSERSCDAFRA